MQLHNTMKEDSEFQGVCTCEYLQFAPGSSWMVYTETVPHAVLAGQYALEQTFLVDPAAMVTPDPPPSAFSKKWPALPSPENQPSAVSRQPSAVSALICRSLSPQLRFP